MKEYIITDDFLDDLTIKFASAQGQPKELIRCKDCKHRPKKKYEDYHEGFNLVFPDDSRCPCECEDPWYNWMPNDDWHCGNAERREK